MKSELSAALCAKYPQIFADLLVAGKKIPFYIEAPDGWYDLIDLLCKQLMFATDASSSDPVPIVLQVKTKFGGLRFYVGGASNRVSGMISMAEAMSHIICEMCGNKAKTRNESWVITLCDDCHKARKQSKK
jgi:hypothetical protein